MSTITFRFNLPVEITEESIRALLLDLQNKGLLYHVDDDPFEAITNLAGDRLFSDEEAYALRGFWDKFYQDERQYDVFALYPEVPL